MEKEPGKPFSGGENEDMPEMWREHPAMGGAEWDARPATDLAPASAGPVASGTSEVDERWLGRQGDYDDVQPQSHVDKPVRPKGGETIRGGGDEFAV